MNILPVDNTSTFKGALSKEVVKHIRKAEALDIVSTVKKANYRGEVLSEEAITTIRSSATNFIENLENLAKALPEKAKIVLQKNLSGTYIRGKYSDRYMKEDFCVFNPYQGGLTGQIKNSSDEYFSMASLTEQSKKLLSAQNVKENIALDVRNSIDKAAKEGKIKSDKSLQKRYDYYKEEFPIVETYRKRHQMYMEEYANKQQVKNENSKYLPLGRRILAKLGF